MKKALKIFKNASKVPGFSELQFFISKDNLDEIIKEFEDLRINIKHSIEEIEHALVKPEYADVYLNNALRFLKEIQCIK